MVIMEHYEKGAVKVMEKGRTLAFQVSEELFQRVKEDLENYEKAYHRRLTQKEFVIGPVSYTHLAATVGYPAPIRTIVLDPDVKMVSTTLRLLWQI